MLLISILLFLVGVNSDESSEHGQFPGERETSCSCGWTNKASGRIVNGHETEINEYPFMAGIRTQFSPFVFCGGTIITEYHVLTAAHCPEEKPYDDLAVIVGDHDVYDHSDTDKARVINVKTSILHEEYNKTGEMEKDIAILVLEKKIPYSKQIGPVCFPTTKLIGRQTVKILGWGKTYTYGPESSVLQKVDMDVIPIESCKKYYGNIETKNPYQLCTYREGKDSCQGDSGGPLIWLDKKTNMYTLVGLVSFGDQCAKKDTPGINTDVFYFKDWITRKIQETQSSSICQRI